MLQKHKQIHAIAAAIFAAAIFFFARVGVAQTLTTLRVMSYNIHHGEGFDGQIDTDRIATLILQENADLVGLQEVDRGTTRVSSRDLIAELAQKTAMSFVFSNNLSFQGGQYGNAILSKFPIKSRDHRLLPKVGSNEQRGWLKAVVNVNGKDFSFWVTHLSSSDEQERMMGVTNLNNWLTNETAPVICVGDFNAVPTSPVYALMAQEWRDVWPQAGQGNGYTIPVPVPNRRIDYIWISKAARSRGTNAHVPFSIASDHLPLVGDVIFTNSLSGNFYFPFNEPDSSNVIDSINGLTGTLGTNSPVRSSESPTGQTGDRSLYFDGTNQINVPDSYSLIATNGTNGDYTLQAWVKLMLNFTPPVRMILFQYERVPGFSFSINANRTLHTTAFNVSDIPSNALFPNDGLWHHVAVVHTSGIDMKFFVDATLANTVSYTQGIGSRTSSTLTVGSSAFGANPFTGFLDRISFSNQALEPAQFDYPSAPTLGVRNEENNVTLFWPAAKTGYSLQMSVDLNSTWTNVSYVIQSNENRAVIFPSNASRFFRLSR